MDVMTAFAFCMVLLLVLLLVGVPLPYCFAGALIFMVATCGIPIKSLFVWGYSQMISTSLMAVPMFIIAGNLIAESSIAEKLVDLARIFVGKVKGALGCICVVVCGIMGAISGSAFTGIAALGSIMIPELQKEGYSRGFATSLVTCSSILGTLIPPSIPIIVLGWTTGISILGCFMATVVPGIITILTFSAINVFYARRYAKKENAEAIEGQVTKAKPKASRAFVEAIPALLLPVIILGGIYGGFFTATEAAGVCSVLALLLGALVYRQLKVKNTMDMLKTTASSIGSIFMMIFFCLLLSQCMTQLKIPQMLVDIFLGFTNNKFVVLIMVNVFLLFVGMIVNDTTAIMLCAPLLMPLLTAYGVNPIHFGALMIVNLSCGCLTPPYASVLYFGMKVGNAKFGEMMKNTLVFLLVGVWHGAQMNYVLWGLYNGVILAFTALVEPVYKRMNDRLPRLTASGGFHVFRILRTFLVVNIGWYFDRCVRVCDAFAMLHKTFFAFNAQQLFDGTLDTLGLAAKDYRILLVATILLFVVSLMQERGVKIRDFVLSRPLALRWAVLYAFIFFVLATFGGSNVAASGFMYAVF